MRTIILKTVQIQRIEKEASSPASSDEIKFRNIERYDGGAYFCGLDFITLLDMTSYQISKNLKINFSE